jgi:signal transduction histidine kinase
MCVEVQDNPLSLSPHLASARLAVDEEEETESSRRASGDSLAANQRGEFLAMVSHELRNLVGSIVNGVAFVRDTEEYRPQSDWVWTGLENATQQVQNLLADLMDLCQATHPTFQLRSRPMDLAAAARAAALRRRPDFEQKGLRLALQLGAEPMWVLADPERLELVLGNLLDNAAKYTEPGGRITVSVEAARDEVVLRVRDTGIGIAPEVLPFVFDPFVRERVPGVRPRQGSGIGLLLVRTLVELHGGRAEASSAGRGQGSEFVIRLPAPDLN